MDAIINRRRYSTETADLLALADDEFLDRTNRLTHGRATHLDRTPRGAYFVFHETIWQHEHDSIEPLTETEAADLYEELLNKNVPFEAAFPGIEVIEA